MPEHRLFKYTHMHFYTHKHTRTHLLINVNAALNRPRARNQSNRNQKMSRGVFVHLGAKLQYLMMGHFESVLCSLTGHLTPV